MSLDAFSVVVAFLAAVELALGVLAVVLGAREARRPTGPAAEQRRPLLVLVAATLLSVALFSVPIFYLLLASWVPRWPGIICIEGVRRIGLGTLGPARWLPDLVSALDATRLLVVFAAGAWAVLHSAGGAPAARRAALAAILLGVVASIDGTLTLAYVAIPKEEVPAEAGCCMAATRGTGRDAGLTPSGAAGDANRSGRIAAGFVVASAVLGVGAGVLRGRRAEGRGGAAALGLLAAFAAASLPLAARFLADVAAPAVLGLPYHHCAWCAFAAAPETIVGASLYLGAVLCAGWALVARLGSPPGGDGAGAARPLLGAALFGFLGTAAMASVVTWFP